MKTLLLLLALLGSGTAMAASETPAATREIGQLFTALENSGCQFNRNGTWYDAHKASSHLHEKYNYLHSRGDITTTESFIDLAATKSSMSGTPYLVQCGKGATVQSKVWFTNELLDLRKKTASVAPPKTVP